MKVITISWLFGLLAHSGLIWMGAALLCAASAYALVKVWRELDRAEQAHRARIRLMLTHDPRFTNKLGYWL